MSIATTRQPVYKRYDACKSCCYNISGYGKCNAGYDNFYLRRNKNNGCDKCQNNFNQWLSARNRLIN